MNNPPPPDLVISEKDCHESHVWQVAELPTHYLWICPICQVVRKAVER